MQVVIDIPDKEYRDLVECGEFDGLHLQIIGAIENGVPVDSALKDLIRRVEIIEKQIQEDKVEQLRKLKAQLDFVKMSIEV